LPFFVLLFGFAAPGPAPLRHSDATKRAGGHREAFAIATTTRNPNNAHNASSSDCPSDSYSNHNSINDDNSNYSCQWDTTRRT